MKKIFTLLVLMLTAMAVNAASYPIKVKDVQITDDNKKDVLGDGTVRYQDSNNMLIFHNANITYDGIIVNILSDMTSKLEINFEGSSTFTTKSHGIYHAGSGRLVIWSSQYDKGSLTINAKEDGRIGIDICNKANVEISALNLTVNAGSTAIGTHLTPTTEEITFTNCNVTLHGDKSAVKAKKVNLSGCNYVKDYAIDGYNSEGRGTFGGIVKTDVKTAIESYNIKVAGIEVTSYNAKDILGEGMAKRTVYFDATTNELTLNNANITTTANNAIYVGNNNKNTSDKTFKIKLIGNNKIAHTVNSSTSLYLWPEKVDSTLIYSTSGGTLEVTANNQYAALGCYIGKIAIKDCSVKLKNNHSTGNALKGYKDATTKYSFINANISVESTGSDVLGDVYGLNYYGCYMKTPVDAYLAADQKLWSASGGSVKQLEIKVGKDDVKPFFFGNNDEITLTEVGTTSAKVSFDYCKDNFTKNENMKYHFFVAKEIINGSWAQSYDEDVYKGSSLIKTEIKNLESGVKYYLRVRATDEAGNSVFYKDLEFTTKVENYSVIVCGTTLSSANLDDFKAQGLTYNPETKVITLENANISYNAGAAIVAGLGDYTIDLKGENTVNGSEAAIGVALGSLTITSSSNGTLSCSSTDAGSATLAAPIGVLTIKDCSVEVYNNNGAGLSGGGVGGLTIDNANVKVYGKQGCICDWMIFEMKNCYVDSPRPTEIGGTEADKNLGIYQNGSPVKGEFVVIKPGVDAINGIAADAKFDGKVYNLQGVQVDENYKGIVVKNGKKYMQK